jgi:iron complex outermembrane recepter protein
MCGRHRREHKGIPPLRWWSPVLVTVLTTVFGLPYAFAQSVSNFDLTDLSIEDLMEQQVTSVSRTEQAFSDTAAATFVMTQDDLRRSGVTSIAEALRMVPGMQVARIDSNKWAITARGFNGRFANKLLVLIDGRTVYTSTFSGVYWDTQDLILILQRDLLSDQYVRYEYQNIAKTGNQPVTRLVC